MRPKEDFYSHREPLYWFNPEVPCDECEAKGSYDINGDNLCEKCIREHLNEYQNDQE